MLNNYTLKSFDIFELPANFYQKILIANKIW